MHQYLARIKKLSEQDEIPCKVCGGKSPCVHYGVIACEGCIYDNVFNLPFFKIHFSQAWVDEVNRLLAAR